MVAYDKRSPGARVPDDFAAKTTCEKYNHSYGSRTAHSSLVHRPSPLFTRHSAEPIDFSSPSAYKCILVQKKKSTMHTTRFLKAVSIVLGLIFLFSILTVESHARETGSLAARLPTIIDGTIEFAVAINDKIDFYVFRAIEYLPLALEVLIINKAAIPPQIYRGPPVITF